MTSNINNENENIFNAKNKNPNSNKENLHNNLDAFINKQLKIAKNHKLKQTQAQISKGLGILDQNNNCIKKSTMSMLANGEAQNENNPYTILPKNYDPIMLKSNYLLYPGISNNIFQCSDLLNLKNINLNSDGMNQIPSIKEDNMELTSKSDIEIISSSEKIEAVEENDGEKNQKDEKDEKALIFSSSPNFLENDILSESEHNKIKENLEKIQNGVVPLDIDINKMFNKRESNNLLLKCGESSYKYNKILEETVFNIPPNFLTRQKITSYIRTKMIDWMLEVLNIFYASEETFFLAVNIMDLFFWKTTTIFKNDSVHLIGVASMFIASKFQEIYPICLKDFVHRIGHDQFTDEEVKKMECKIFRDIKPECLVSTSVYDFNKTYFYDFYYNNKNLIKTDEDAKIFKYIKLTSIYLNKLILHYEIFYQEKCSLKAIACIVTSMKILCDCLKDKFAQKTRGIYNDWMLFLIEQGGFNKKKVESIANTIYNAYLHYQKSKSISKNLNRFSPLPFVKK